MAMTHLFVFMEMVLMEGVGWVNLGDTSKLDEASSSLLFHPTCTASLLLGRASGRGGTSPQSVCWAEMPLLRDKVMS